MLAKRAAFLFLLAFPLTARAGGWQEAHETSDDVRIEIGPDGVANVQHHLRYRVVAGHFLSFDLAGIDPRAELSTDAVMTPEKQGGATIPAHVEAVPKTPGTVRIVLDDAKKGITRGAYLIDVKYKLDLVATKMLVRDGAMWKVTWTAPPAPEGHDGARVVIDVPSAPTEPRLAAAAESTTTLATVRRGNARDELELVRTHVTRGDAVMWSARIDPKAFPRVVAPDLRPPPVEAETPSLLASNLSRALVAAAFAALAGGLALLLRAKQRRVRQDAERRHMIPRPLLPWSAGPFAYGVVVALALATLLWWSPIAGAGLVVLAMALAAHRAPSAIAKPRCPGAWQPMSDPSVLLPPPTAASDDALDLGTTRARLVVAAITLAVGAAAWLLRTTVPQIAVALPLASTALIPVFVTGTRAQVPPRAIELAARVLRPARDAIASAIDLTHVELTTIGRVTTEGLDELRLSGTPRDRTPGLRAIELALATRPDGYAAFPEVFVRFDGASPAARRIATLDAAAPLSGRGVDEKVVRLLPDEPTPAAAASLVARLLVLLEGRRASDRSESSCGGGAWMGMERRGSPRTLSLC